MSWGRIDDTFYDHPKVRRLDLAVLGLWLKCLSFCGRHLTDGEITTADVIDLSRMPGGRAKRLAAKLVESGLWEATSAGYRFHDYLKYSPSKEQVFAEREATRQRVGRFRERQDLHRDSSTGRFGNGVSNENVTPLVTPGVTPLVTPLPSRPVPYRDSKTLSSCSDADPKSGLRTISNAWYFPDGCIRDEFLDQDPGGRQCPNHRGLWWARNGGAP